MANVSPMFPERTHCSIRLRSSRLSRDYDRTGICDTAVRDRLAPAGHGNRYALCERMATSVVHSDPGLLGGTLLFVVSPTSQPHRLFRARIQSRGISRRVSERVPRAGGFCAGGSARGSG